MYIVFILTYCSCFKALLENGGWWEWKFGRRPNWSQQSSSGRGGGRPIPDLPSSGSPPFARPSLPSPRHKTGGRVCLFCSRCKKSHFWNPYRCCYKWSSWMNSSNRMDVIFLRICGIFLALFLFFVFVLIWNERARFLLSLLNLAVASLVASTRLSENNLSFALVNKNVESEKMWKRFQRKV